MSLTFPCEADGDGLEELHDNAAMLAPGYAFEYRGLTLEKADGPSPIGPADHTAFTVRNADGRTVERVTVGAFETVDDLRALLDELAEYDPANLADWLNRGAA